MVSQEKLLFGVLVDGKQTENPVIDLGDVYYDQVYRDHSFIILNQSDMALDFLVSYNNRPPCWSPLPRAASHSLASFLVCVRACVRACGVCVCVCGV